jgi:SulP family sulfate permease
MHTSVKAAAALLLLLGNSSCHHMPVHGFSVKPITYSFRGGSIQTPLVSNAGVKVNGTGSNAGTEENGNPTPTTPTQIESILANAKLLNPFGTLLSSEKSVTVLQSLAAGLAVSLAMVPEAVSFAFVAGVNPLVGLWTTVALGFVAAAFGGRAGICSSASGACSVVVAALCASHGPAYLSACALLAGMLQILGGALGFGKFIRLVPHPVMLGFVNGLTVVMVRSQLVHFKDVSSGAFLAVNSAKGAAMYGLTAITILLVKFLPKIPTLKAVPPTLGAVMLTTILANILKLPVKTLADGAGAETFRGGMAVLPSLSFPSVPFSLETLKVVAPFAITMAAVGCIESLLTMQLLDGIADDGKRGSTKKECIGQGLGNIASGITGGIGGCALLGQSVINVQSGGGKSRLSGMSMAVFLALGIVAAAPLLASVPVASLVGIMLIVCQSTFSWSSLRIFNKIPRLDAAVIALVSGITVKYDLAKAVFVGVIVSALAFAWKQSTLISASEAVVLAPVEFESKGTADKEQKWKTYNLRGPLFFGSTTQFSTLFDVKGDPQDVIIDFTDSRVMDHSALEAINTVSSRYSEAGKTVHLRHLSSDCATLLRSVIQGNENYSNTIIEPDPKTDPVYGIADDYRNFAASSASAA